MEKTSLEESSAISVCTTLRKHKVENFFKFKVCLKNIEKTSDFENLKKLAITAGGKICKT